MPCKLRKTQVKGLQAFAGNRQEGSGAPFSIMCHVFIPNMLRSRLWQACQRSAAIPACSAPEAATQWQTPCSAAHLTQTRNFEIGVVRDKLSNAIREYREIVQKDRLKYYWDRKVGFCALYTCTAGPCTRQWVKLSAVLSRLPCSDARRCPTAWCCAQI